MKKNLLAFFSLLLMASLAFGQARDYPNHAVKIIVPFPTGSSIDITARYFADQLSIAFGQPFVVENRAGANGAIGVAAVKAAPVDGYTILMGSNSSLSVNPLVVKNLPYDPIKDLKPISGLTRIVSVLVVAENGKYRTLADLVNAAKVKTGDVTVGTFAAGYLLGQAWFASEAGVQFRHIPYKAVTQVLTDIIGNQLDFTIVDSLSAASLIQAGKLRALAVSGDRRHADYPNIPTFVESGYPEYVNYLWNGYFVRADMPDDITNKLADAMAKIIATPAARDFARKSGLEVLPLGPDAMRKYHIADLERLRKVANSAGIKPE